MSSFIGHSLAAATIDFATESVCQPLSFATHLKVFLGKRVHFIWLSWLIVVASIPYLDYVVKAWQSSNNQGLTITHSILFIAITSDITIVLLFAIKIKEKKLSFGILSSAGK